MGHIQASLRETSSVAVLISYNQMCKDLREGGIKASFLSCFFFADIQLVLLILLFS